VHGCQSIPVTIPTHEDDIFIIRQFTPLSFLMMIEIVKKSSPKENAGKYR
jgi:hypothetical protein